MKRIMRWIRFFVLDCRGQSIVEYAIIVVFVVVVGYYVFSSTDGVVIPRLKAYLENFAFILSLGIP